MNERVYLDWNASAPLRREARETMLVAMEALGNPSSVHREGRRTRQLVEHARDQVAALVGAEPRNVVFTSGGTEANVLALTPTLETAGHRRPRERLLISAIEHASVQAGGRFPSAAIRTIRVLADGVLDLAHLQTELAAAARVNAPALVSVMLANNETGTVQPVRTAADLIHAADAILHVDAVQATGRIPVHINDLQADLLSISAHKIGGPQGVGALIRRDSTLHFPQPLITGGGQERGLRAGTENVAAIAGFGAAAEATLAHLEADRRHMLALRDRLEGGITRLSSGAVIFARQSERVPNAVLFALPGVKAETALIALDLDGVAVSSGAACSSGRVAPSHVLAAMGVEPELAAGAIRVSFGHSTTAEDIDRFLRAWEKLVRTLSKGAQGIAA